MQENYVPYPPLGLVIALQYWEGDEARAMRVARLLADIEPRRRHGIALAFCRRFDMPETDLLAQTMEHCAPKFAVTAIRSTRPGAGHPAGCNELWSGSMEALTELWAAGHMNAASVFFIEADGAPLTREWLGRLQREHQMALASGKRITGALMASGGERARIPHVNGTLIAHLSIWPDRPSLHRTPADQAWDVFHSAVLSSEARPTTQIKNVYGARRWSAAALKAMAKETAWLSSTKDDSALEWAERTLVKRAPA